MWAIELAYEGKAEMLRHCFGGAAEPAEDQEGEGLLPATSNRISSLFGKMAES